MVPKLTAQYNAFQPLIHIPPENVVHYRGRNIDGTKKLPEIIPPPSPIPPPSSLREKLELDLNPPELESPGKNVAPPRPFFGRDHDAVEKEPSPPSPTGEFQLQMKYLKGGTEKDRGNVMPAGCTVSMLTS